MFLTLNTWPEIADHSLDVDMGVAMTMVARFRDCTAWIMLQQGVHFICLFFVRTRSYSSSIAPMNELSLCQNGG